MHFNRKFLLYSLISNMFIYYITVDIDLIVYIQCDIEKKTKHAMYYVAWC